MAADPSRYRGPIVLCVAVLAGWAWDFALGGGRTHAVAWLAALIVVGGITALAAHGAPEKRVATKRAGAPAETGAGEKNGARKKGARAQAAIAEPAFIRAPLPDELPELIEIEQAADKLFEVAGYGSTPGPASLDELRVAALLLVAGQPPVGYVRVELVDGQPHIEGLSVRPKSMRRGVGSALVRAAGDWAVEHGFSQLTLCTFVDVPWNGPFYAGLGFTELREPTPGLRALRETEARLGLDAMGRRWVMRRQLPAGPGTLDG